MKHGSRGFEPTDRTNICDAWATARKHTNKQTTTTINTNTTTTTTTTITSSTSTTTYIYMLYRVSQEEYAILRESVPYVKLYRYNPKHLYPKLNGYGDNGHRKKGACVVSTYCSLRDAIHVHCA